MKTYKIKCVSEDWYFPPDYPPADFSWNILVIKCHWGSHGTTQRWCRRRGLELQLLPWYYSFGCIWKGENTQKIHPFLCSSQLFCVVQSMSLTAAQTCTVLPAVYKLSKDTHILLFIEVPHSPGNYITIFPISISILGIKFKKDLSLVPNQGFILWQSLSLFYGCCGQKFWSEVWDLGYHSNVISPFQFLLLISAFQWGFTRSKKSLQRKQPFLVVKQEYKCFLVILLPILLI